jgi:hypothetical protein
MSKIKKSPHPTQSTIETRKKRRITELEDLMDGDWLELEIRIEDGLKNKPPKKFQYHLFRCSSSEPSTQ